MAKKKEIYLTEGEGFGFVIIGFLLGCFVLTFALFAFGAFEEPYKKLGVSEDSLARYHVLKYYPEYENCSIVYDLIDSDGWTNKYGAKVYCNSIDNRDGMRVNIENQPTIELIFEDITLEQIFKELIEEAI